ncbi:MAG TPA: ATP-binding protein [Burkholderiales bacterium]|nr:ATP-binding protein [Burkholderiales bacterium]
MRSIRKRLLLLQLSAMLLVSALALGGAYYRVRDVFYEMQDYHLEQVALLLLQQGQLIDAGGKVLEPEEDDLDFIGQIWSENGKLLYSSHRDYPIPQLNRSGLSTVNWDGELFRVFAVSSNGRTVQVAQSLEVREEALHDITLRLVTPLALLVPVLGLATWLTVGRGLRPLRALRDEVTQRNQASLTPIALDHAPDEVKPLVESLNGLLGRLSGALDSQRRFTADAAHELRTPLTAVKLQFQLLERAPSDGQRQEAVENLKAGIERAIHLVNQLLTLARLEPDASRTAQGPVSLTSIAQQVATDFEPIAASKRIALSWGGCATAQVQGNEEQLRTLLNNVVDNALRYTPPGGKVQLSLSSDAQQVRFEVDDSGPGIPQDERGRVFDRFYRLAGSGVPGSGLGLSIAGHIAQAHGATIELNDSPLGGLRVSITFPS